MKRIASILLCAVMLISSAVLFAVPASAAEKVVYVSDGATGDGSSATSPLGTLDAAISALSTSGGTIKVVGEVTLVANASSTYDADPCGYYSAPKYDRQITITSNDKVNKAKLIWTADCQWFALSGPTVIENIKLVHNIGSSQARLLARGNHLTMGEGLEMYLGDVLQDTSVIAAGFSGFSVSGLTTKGAEYDGYLSQDTWLTFKSGIYSSIIGKARNTTTEDGEFTGKTYMEFLGEFTIREMGMTGWAGATQAYDKGEAFIYWAAPVHGWRLFPGYNHITQTPYTCTMILDEGARFVDVNGAPLGLVGGAKVQVIHCYYTEKDSEVADLALTFSTLSMTQAGAMFDVDTLDKYNGPAYRRTEDVAPLDEAAATEAPVVTDAPVVTTAAPVVTTAAPAQAEPTPSTGDASVMVVFAAAAALCIAAVVVIKKREN